jgi:hypothetical protein
MWYACIMTTQQIEEQDFHVATEAEWHNQWHYENPDKGTCPWDCGRNEDPSGSWQCPDDCGVCGLACTLNVGHFGAHMCSQDHQS